MQQNFSFSPALLSANVPKWQAQQNQVASSTMPYNSTQAYGKNETIQYVSAFAKANASPHTSGKMNASQQPQVNSQNSQLPSQQSNSTSNAVTGTTIQTAPGVRKVIQSPRWNNSRQSQKPVRLYFSGVTKTSSLNGGCSWFIVDAKNAVVGSGATVVKQFVPSKIGLEIEGLLNGLQAAQQKGLSGLVIRGCSEFIIRYFAECNELPYFSTMYHDLKDVFNSVWRALAHFQFLEFEIITEKKNYFANKLARNVLVGDLMLVKENDYICSNQSSYNLQHISSTCGSDKSYGHYSSASPIGKDNVSVMSVSSIGPGPSPSLLSPSAAIAIGHKPHSSPTSVRASSKSFGAVIWGAVGSGKGDNVSAHSYPSPSGDKLNTLPTWTPETLIQVGSGSINSHYYDHNPSIGSNNGWRTSH